MIAGKNGVTADTVKNILFGAGTIHKDLKYTEGTGWNFAETCVGATSGGSKLSIVPEVYDVPVDGADVLVKGLRVKTGEKATMEVNLIELSSDVIAAAAMGVLAEAEMANYDMIQSKPDIEIGDYWGNIAFVGKMLNNQPVIAILDNALCTTGFETEGKNKEGSVGKYTFECHADPDTDMDKLPWKIYYPKATA
jgi:hypothetical protein